jgi:hypothetical protein
MLDPNVRPKGPNVISFGRLRHMIALSADIKNVIS